MPIATTKAAQETAVGEGLALGLVALDVGSFNGSKMTVEFAFQRAWRDWSHRGEGSQLCGQRDRGSTVVSLHNGDCRLRHG